MSLVTWQAIGAVVLMAIPSMLAPIALILAYHSKDDVNQISLIGASLILGFLFIVQLSLFWELIGVGLFGVTR